MHADIFLKRHLVAVLIAGLVFLSSAYLFMKNDRELDPNYQKNWWTIAFVEPDTPSSLDFVLENHTLSNTFIYEIWSENALLETQTVEIPSGHNTTILVSNHDALDTKKTIRVWPANQPGNVYSLYRR